ncbi:MAG: TRAP transporter substrate-binding protein [Betaproteobacteria bacterium]|nr:MAG: TRAP transporter substrate-binding protein [Betaproteobacteria bacterium]TMH68922.1 MAG: TRAP transporter substrate-binding protein [Betaproteobacteria bacterium]
MKLHSRASAALGVLFALSMLAAGDATGQIRMSIGWDPPADEHPMAVAGNAFKKLVEQYSNGQIQVQVYCCFKMGSEEEMVKKLQLGTLDATIVAQNNVGPSFRLYDVFTLPYIFRDYDHAVKVLDGPIGKKLSEKAVQSAGFYVFSSTSIAFRNLYNTKRPINAINDVPGLRYRVPPNPVPIATYKAFGADPTPLPWGETLTATQTGIVDGGDMEPTGFLVNKFADVAKYMAVTEHFTLIAPLLVSDKFMKRLTPEQQAEVTRAAFEAAKVGQDAELKLEKTIYGTLGNMGVKFTHPDKKPFMQAAVKVVDDVSKQRGPEFADLVKQIQETH